VFDCFGAGQQLVQVTFGGHTWREDPALATAQFALLSVLRQLHESLWYLTEALGLPAAGPLHDEVRTALTHTERLTGGSPDELASLDVAAHRGVVGELLGRVSDLVRGRGPDHRGADLMGRDLRRTDLRGASLRGAYLIGADLRGVDLGTTDLLGADLRGTHVSGANLSRCLFLTPPQVEAARGDMSTRLPVALERPTHWR
jgi:hypothetical protein